MTNLEKKLFVEMVNKMIENGKTKNDIQFRLSQCDCDSCEITEILECSNYYKYKK